MNNWILGLTGGIGSGKTAASDYLASKGISIVDSDMIAREIVQPGQPAWLAIREHFGEQAIQGSGPQQGQLDRAWLRQQVFADPSQRQWLEQLTHPLIRQRTLASLQAATSTYVVLVSPLLLESGQKTLVQRVLVIDVPTDVQEQRAGLRDGNSPEQIRAIIAAQISRAERLQQADDIVDNSATPQHLQQQLDNLHQQYLALASKHKNGL
jgi:dephospho-CoA kinase